MPERPKLNRFGSGNVQSSEWMQHKVTKHCKFTVVWTLDENCKFAVVWPCQAAVVAIRSYWLAFYVGPLPTVMTAIPHS
jgi:hypothetical protein